MERNGKYALRKVRFKMEKIISITEINDVAAKIAPISSGGNAAPGIMQMMSTIINGGMTYDGYKIVTSEHEYTILIDNMQNCCENWGYIVSEDNFEDFIGKELISVELTDTALNKDNIENIAKYKEDVDSIIKSVRLDWGGIQFVDFKTTDGNVLQFAVYNEHNGYYGHSIIVAKDNEILLSDVL